MDFSVDMIRISTRVSVVEFSSFYQMISFNPEVHSYIGRGLSEYHYNFSVAENLLQFGVDFLASDYNKFYFAYQHNSEKGASDYGKFTFVLEYNPNKCFVGFGLLNFILRNFFNDVDKIQLRSCDLCCDFYDVPIDNFVFDKNRKRYVCDLTGNNGRTIYIGKRGSNGRVKIYDKAAEVGLNDRVWTRYEVTLTFDDTYFSRVLFSRFKVDVMLPYVYVNTGQLMLIQDAKLRAAVLCIQNGLMTINDFAKDFRKKIRSYLADSSSFVIDDEIENDLTTCILNYVRDLSIQFTDYQLLKK